MKKGLLFSFILHGIFLSFMWIKMPEFLPEKEIKAIQVRLVTAPQPKKSTKKAVVKKVKTQQSAAPKNPPKKQVEKVEKPKPKKPKVKITKKIIKKPKPKKIKPQPKPQEKPKPKQVKKVEKKAKPKDKPRPPKLDKTPDKKTMVKEAKPKYKEEIAKKAPEDFLKALDFIESLKGKQDAMLEGEESEPTTINLAEQTELALIKKHIERNWYKPSGIAGEYLIIMRLEVNPDGTLADMEIIESSGEMFLDKSLERAVRKSSPLPIPPDKYKLFQVIELYWNSES